MDEIHILKKILDQLGFPICVSLWLMLRTDKRLDKLADLHREMIDACRKKE